MSALASISKQESLGGSSARGLRNLVIKVRELNFLDNADLDAGINQLELLMEQDPKDRPLATLTAVLQDLATLALAHLVKFGEQPRVSRDLGLADLPDEVVITRARRNLGLLPSEEESDPVPGTRAVRQPRLALAC